MGGETLEYLESLFDAGDFEELENNGECLSDWIVVDTKIGDKMNIESTGLDYPKYVPNVKKFPGEYYNSFAELKAARPDLFEGEERSAYHVEW